MMMFYVFFHGLDSDTNAQTLLNITPNGFEDKYLALYVPEGRMQAGKFESTKDKALKRLSDQMESMLLVE